MERKGPDGLRGMARCAIGYALRRHGCPVWHDAALMPWSAARWMPIPFLPDVKQG